MEMHNRVARHLENLHISISSENEWFKQCVNFFISNNPNCNVNDLSSMVAEQLSLSDFQEIALSSLPVNLKDNEKKILNGKYCLQVNTILDVGQSCYSQYNVLVKRDTTNTEISDTKPAPWEPKPNRMLKMMCTDGQQDVMAMEYEPLPNLKEPFIPGFKIAVVGPIEYRKGVLLLKSNSVHFIGGEVEHLLIKNAPLNVLCRALNKPELENPYIFSNLEVESNNTEEQLFQNINSPREISNDNNRDDTTRLQNTRITHNSNPQSNNSGFVGNGVITYDDFFDGDDDELLYLTQVAEIETKFAQSNNTVESTPLQTFNAHQNIIKKEQKPTKSVSKNNKVETIKKTATTTRQTKISDILGPSTSTSSSSSLLSTVRQQNDNHVKVGNTADIQTLGKRVASSPLHTDTKRPSVEQYRPEEIWDDINMDIDVSNPLIKILKCTSVYKNSKIQVKQNEWVCAGILLDANKHLEVEFSSKVLERLIGISSTEVLQIKDNPLNCAPLKEKIEKGIKGALRKLHLFKGEITLTYSSDKNKKPIVTDMKI
ncbi:Hypothetical protein CINCED_3A012740 [Cinara cedri]|nr:Hypothetical protein CINCED_3A012740 [Cinara cedri]